MMKKMTKKMDNDIQMDNYIQMTKKLKTKKLCNHDHLKMMGKFLQTSPMENDGTVCYTVTLIKSFSFVPISFGYVASYGGDSIESESSVALLLSNSIYKAHPPKNITVSKIFLLLRKKEMRMHLLLKSENMLRH